MKKGPTKISHTMIDTIILIVGLNIHAQLWLSIKITVYNNGFSKFTMIDD